MTTDPTWPDIALRLVLTVVAGAIIGVNRGEHGRPVGLRTTILVCLAAAASMILANLILPMQGKTPDSYSMMDVMRLPLGVLTGVGFIGAGAILHKSNFVTGVTTAATLWYVTVMGFCFGWGDHGLGLALLAIGVFVLWGLKALEHRWLRCREATLKVVVPSDSKALADLPASARARGCELSEPAVSLTARGRECSYQVSWTPRRGEEGLPSLVEELMIHPEVRELEWVPVRRS